MTRGLFIILLIVSSAILLAPLILYFSVFNGPLSSDSAHWRDFATFTAMFVTVVNMLIIASISVTTSRTTALFQERQLRPHVFIFENTRINQQIPSARTWQMTNSSGVPAINVMARFAIQTNNQLDWSKWVICFSLKKDDSREFGWIHFAHVIEICYTNISHDRWYLYRFQDYTGTESSLTLEEFQQIATAARQTFFPGGNVVVTTNNVTDGLIANIATVPQAGLNAAIAAYLRSVLF
jgi:hypothetical protein